VVGVAGSVKVGNEKNIPPSGNRSNTQRRRISDRRAFDQLNCITVIPGAIGAFEKTALLRAGGLPVIHSLGLRYYDPLLRNGER